MQVLQIIISSSNPFIRPLNKTEIKERQPSVCRIDEVNKEVIVELKGNNKGMSKSFFFDAVYGSTSTQRDIYVVIITLHFSFVYLHNRKLLHQLLKKC